MPPLQLDPDDTQEGTVPASGNLTLEFTPTSSGMTGGSFATPWEVHQVSYELVDPTTGEQTAPAGCTINLKRSGTLVAPGYTARRGAFGGDPPVPVRPGERLQVAWTGATPGLIGRAFIIYRRGDRR